MVAGNHCYELMINCVQAKQFAVHDQIIGMLVIAGQAHKQTSLVEQRCRDEKRFTTGIHAVFRLQRAKQLSGQIGHVSSMWQVDVILLCQFQSRIFDLVAEIC